MEAHPPNSLDLLVGNLRLLNYDVHDANQVFRLQLEDVDSNLYLKGTSQKLIIHTVHFLLGKICLDDPKEFENHFRIYYPPRTIQEQIDYKKQFIDYLRRVEKTGRIPKNFTYCKAILDEKQGLRQIKFLRLEKIQTQIRFLSEFALRHDFIHQFPCKQLKTFYPDPKELMINYTNKSTFNDLSDIFQPASFQLEGPSGIQMDKCSVNDETLHAMIGLIKIQINTKLQKLNKIFLRNVLFIENVDSLVFFLNEKNNQLRQQIIDVEQKSSITLFLIEGILKNKLSKKDLSAERQLDRIPMIDLYKKVFKDVRSVLHQYKQLNIDQKIYRFNEDFEINDSLCRLERQTITFDKVDYIDINKIYQKQEQQIIETNSNIEQLKSKSYLLFQSQKLKNDSYGTLQQLRSLRANQ